MKLKYILITPAYNEEIFIEKTIQSVINQTILPIKWIIVSDGSTDNTNTIIEKYSNEISWITLIELDKNKDRNFASKVHAFNVGLKKVKDIKHDIICCLDADISFDSDYFEYLIEKFERQPQLGVAGTDYIEGEFHSYKHSYIDEQHVNGGCQLFRKECFASIGGYVAVKSGGIDWIAVTTARMKGWKTQSFPDRVFYHHRKIGTAESNIFMSYYKYGVKDYFLGGHPLWEIFRITFQMTRKPYIIGGTILSIGYLSALIRRINRPISKELVQFHRKEQMTRLKLLLKKGFKRNI
jgi:glycosyltransferase involved in cell wall biosynthesis